MIRTLRVSLRQLRGNFDLDARRRALMVAHDGFPSPATQCGGKASFPGVAPGTYYLVVTAGSNTQPVLWNLKVRLDPGDNTIILDQRNATPIP